MTTLPWQEGDALTPTNLNTKGVFPSAIYNAAWVTTGATNAAKVNTAIATAAANGFTAVFVPVSLQPYDATAVTFNDAVHMIREGGSQDMTIWDVKAYGAAGNNSQDDYAAIAAANSAVTNALSADSQSTGELYFPLGTYRISQPIQITAQGLRVRGQGYVQFNATAGMTKFRATYAYGPMMLVGNWDIVTTTKLVTGSGFALRFNNDSAGWFNLRDAATLDINGLTAFSVECFINFDTLTNSVTRNIIRSKGQWLTNDAESSAFHIRQEIFGGTTRLAGSLTTSDGTFTVNSAGGALTAATTYHIAMTYDGANLRLYAAIPGASSTVLATTAATGTVVQDVSEDVMLGVETRYTPEGYDGVNPSFGSTGGTIDSIRISNSARYTGTITAPSAKFTSDANTLLLMNFDKQVGPMTRAYTKNGDAYLTLRAASGYGVAYSSTGEGSSCELENLGFDDSAATGHMGLIVGYNISHVRLRRLRGFDLRTGLLLLSNSFFFRWEDLLFQSTGGTGKRYGVLLGFNSSFMQTDALTVVDYVIPLAFEDGHGTLNDLNILTGTNTKMGMLIRGSASHGAWVFNTPYLDTEVGTATAWRGGIGMALTLAPQTAVFNGGIFESSRSQPAILCDDWNSAIFNACQFPSYSSATAIMSCLSAPRQPFIFNNCIQRDTFVPWSDTTGSATVGKLGAFSGSTGSTVILDGSRYDTWRLVLTSDVTQSFLTHVGGADQKFSLEIVQDSTASRLWTFPTNMVGGAAASTGSNAVSTYQFAYSGTTAYNLSSHTGM